MTTGRPTKYDPELAIEILVQIAEGYSLRTICKRADMPDKATVFRWLWKHEDFCDQYARAQEARSHAMAEEILEIADTPQEGVRLEDGENKDGAFSKVIKSDMLEHRRLRVDTRKWIMSKHSPKRYGVATKVVHEGGDKPVQHEEVNANPYELARRMAFILDRGARAAKAAKAQAGEAGPAEAEG